MNFDLPKWLADIGLPDYAEAFLAEGVDKPGLQELSDADLRELGVDKMGHRKTILREAAKLASGSATAPGLPAHEPTTESSQSSAADNLPPSPEAATFGATDTPLKLFLSYGRDDHVLEVKALLQALRLRGHEVWFDEEQLATGLDWEQRIEKGLQWCDKVVLTMTPHSVRRPDGYCLNEIAKAMEQQKLIVPVLLVEIPNGAPTSICRIQYLDWRDAMPAAEKADRFMHRLKRLCEAIEHDKLDFEGGQQRLQRQLQPLNYDGDIRRHVARFEGRSALEQRLREWLNEPNAAQVLWLTGSPGLGKSAIAAWLAHRWAEAGAMHFCQAGHLDKADPVRAVLSIAYQLSQHLDLYRARLSNLELEREAQKNDARTLFDTLLVGPLARQYPEPDKPCVVILDGLDEATRNDGSNPLAQLVAADWARLPRWLRLIVSSRPDAEVQQWLSGVHTLSLSGQDPEQQADLLAYLDRQLQAMGRPVGPQVLQRILQASEGAFHYTVLLLEEVRQGRCNPEDPVDLPAGMNQIYLQSFKRRFADATEYRGQTRPLLELILASPEPVPLAVLARATKREVCDVRQDLVALGSLVALEAGESETDSDWDTVRLSHSSLRNWLTELGASRQPLAGPYSVKVNTKGLAAEVLAMWEAGNQPQEGGQDAHIERKTFVARTLWALLEITGNEDAMGDVAFDLSRYWEGRSLALAIGPGAWIAEAGWIAHEEQPEDTELSAGVGLFLDHLGGIRSALGQSEMALNAYRKCLVIFENLSELKAKDDRLQQRGDTAVPDYSQQLDALQGRLSHCYTSVGGVLEIQGDLDGALKNFRNALFIAERRIEQDPANVLWLRYHCIGCNRVGSVLEAQGNLKAALEEFYKMLSSAERLTSHDPENDSWWGYLSTSHNRIGGGLEAQGKLDAALKEFRMDHAITERLAKKNPGSTWWQQSIATSHNRIGLVHLAQGKLDDALAELRNSMALTERLSQEDPDNAERQALLANALAGLGGVYSVMGDLTGALQIFQKELAIAERLATKDPVNARWQRDLTYSLSKTGECHEQLGQFSEATRLWRRELEVRVTIALQNEDSSKADDELSSCHHQIGGALEAMGDFKGACNAYNEYLRLSQNILRRDPDDATKQRNVAVGQANVARSELALGHLAQAQTLHIQVSQTFQALRDDDDAGSQIDWAAALALGAEIARAAGDKANLVALQDKLATLELGSEEPEGRFRKRFMPLIEQHLAAGLARRQA